mmetsp:Transcript_20540/g.51716  ORF Transcript_20540/g.51716 Transcript_20540/m.51716 type:complete len:207 (-) Transcript_20540:880-1500(-)
MAAESSGWKAAAAGPCERRLACRRDTSASSSRSLRVESARDTQQAATRRGSSGLSRRPFRSDRMYSCGSARVRPAAAASMSPSTRSATACASPRFRAAAMASSRCGASLPASTPTGAGASPLEAAVAAAARRRPASWEAMASLAARGRSPRRCVEPMLLGGFQPICASSSREAAPIRASAALSALSSSPRRPRPSSHSASSSPAAA